VSQENELGVRRFAFRITESSVSLMNVSVTGDYEGPSTSDMDIYNTPWLHEAPKTVEESASEPHSPHAPLHVPTEEEKREIDSILGVIPLTKAQKMAKLEEEPLEGMDRQFFELNGVIYVRDRGQRKFRESKPMTLEEMQVWMQRQHDSLAALPNETEYEVKVWLTKQEDLEYARQLVDSLKPTGEPDCYLTRTSVEVIHKLMDRGIRLRRQE